MSSRATLGGILAATFAAVLAVLPTTMSAQARAASAPFTLEQVTSAPFANNLTTAATSERLAWTLNERGLRNIWVAEGPAFTARRLTNYAAG